MQVDAAFTCCDATANLKSSHLRVSRPQGYEKLPNYEDKMCAFLRAVVDGEKSGGGYGPATFGACSQL